MPVSTFLHDSELNRPLPDAEVQQDLDEVRRVTGRDWQIVNHPRYEPQWFRRARIVNQWSLYLYVGGFGPWQDIRCAAGPDLGRIHAYLLGFLGGSDAIARAALNRANTGDQQ